MHPIHLLWLLPLLFLIGNELSKTDVQMFQFPYYAEIWGTVSDWGMLFVTGLTALYLIKTFRSQQEVTRIEQNNFRLRVLPRFSAKLTGSGIQVTIHENAIKILDTYYHPLNRFTYFNMYHHSGDFDPGAEIVSEMGFHLSKDGDGKMKSNVLHDEIYFFFLDTQNNLYKETLIYNPNYQYVRPQTPVFIENLKSTDQFKDVVEKIQKNDSLIRNPYY